MVYVKVFFAVLLLFSFALSAPCVSKRENSYEEWFKLYASGVENRYGKFVETKVHDDYTVTFVLDPLSEKFSKVQEVGTFDYGDDGKSDIAFVFYRDGKKEIFFRDRRNYERYSAENASANVCKTHMPWLLFPKKIVYRRNTWECKSDFLGLLFPWTHIDQGIAEAKRGDWDALLKRILENAGRIVKK